MGPVRPGTRNITEILLEAGVVDDHQVQAALEHQREAGIRVGEALVELGAANEYDIGWALARQLGLSFVELQPDSLDRDLVLGFPVGTLRQLLAVPLVRTDTSLSVAFGDPTDRGAVREVERLAGRPVVASVAAPSEIRMVLDALAESAEGPLPRHSGRAAAHAHRVTVMREGSGAHVLSGAVQRALEAGANEIHFLPEGDGLRILHRVGGRLEPAGTAAGGMVYPLLARLDALGGPAWDGEETHAQGRALCRIGGEDVLLDVSLLGIEAGLAITLGLRPAHRAAPTLEELGLDGLDVACIRAILDEPSGVVLVCGPPRSGCSTTLSSLLAAVPGQGRRWAEIVVGQNADVVALDDVFTGEHVRELLASEADGRLVLASTDWTDTFALLEHLVHFPGGGAILASRLRLVVQQRMAVGARAPRPVFEPLVVGDALRESLREGVAAARLRAVAVSEGHRAGGPGAEPR